MTIHPTAVISDKAELHPTVKVGPFAVIEEGVKIGAGTTVASHAVLFGPTSIGENNTVCSFTTIGGAPQDISYKGEPTELIIGDGNLIREYASIHRGTPHGTGKTVVGSNNMIMAYSHVGHDCVIGDHVILVNAATLGGHVQVGDRATVGGLVGVHQFCRIGRFAFIGGGSGVGLDVPPFAMVTGMRGKMRISGLNKVGMRRNGFPRETISKLERAFRILYRSSDLLYKDAIKKVEEEIPGCEYVAELVEFFRTSKRGVVKRIKSD
ncbi:MAG: acyl-ACP--UDP-N-acetylglucosamine O-acyltransferase [Proteobacteria bacterium]|nr:acyl-ACP--UDP-N-acetylglucosamine O-acyltransferase [Pseudomonadota bacterium]MBU1419122.1 acyl-ACP--UDP-N-acetylglucosamine O-acyltransferase [Pseudomonadota bacterium]MBU1455978.1 acyl-ACP--UDP-N-acetylglucosamine O-acyltransferase [Pseudomonadota bacterium]